MPRYKRGHPLAIPIHPTLGNKQASYILQQLGRRCSGGARAPRTQLRPPGRRWQCRRWRRSSSTTSSTSSLPSAPVAGQSATRGSHSHSHGRPGPAAPARLGSPTAPETTSTRGRAGSSRTLRSGGASALSHSAAVSELAG
ncbi:hypothetical protein ACQJBY_005501 [Aegilops geniculata]